MKTEEEIRKEIKKRLREMDGSHGLMLQVAADWYNCLRWVLEDTECQK